MKAAKCKTRTLKQQRAERKLKKAARLGKKLFNGTYRGAWQWDTDGIDPRRGAQRRPPSSDTQRARQKLERLLQAAARGLRDGEHE